MEQSPGPIPSPAASAASPAGRLTTPVPERQRIVAMDLLRGLAILGIFCVNIQLFSRPFGDLFGPIGGADASAAEIASWMFIKVFCEYKFISLFSLLFGMGLAMQMARAKAAGGGFIPMYLRRLAVLALIGLVHALGLWYGDILFVYACFGMVLLALSFLSARAQIITGACMIVAVALLTAVFNVIQIGANAAMQSAPDAAVVESPEAAPPAAESADGEVPPTETGATAPEEADEAAVEPPEVSDSELLRTSPLEAPVRVLLTDPESLFGRRWRDLEVQAYREGPLASAVAMRLAMFSITVSSAVFSYGWRVVGLFLIGAGLLKLRFFAPDRRPWHRRMLVVGLVVGLPMQVMGAALLRGELPGRTWSGMLGDELHYFGSLFLLCAYVGGVTLLAGRGHLSILERGVAAVGRMALTNYLMQTVSATYVMYWWGMGRFDTFGRAQMLAMVAGVYAGQMVLSLAWFTVFRIGPVEWLWRSLTYLRIQPILRPRTVAAGREEPIHGRDA